ncbi:MAG: hypothetical protein JXB39_14040 [Deltaproteobacteria bacterium]|nr:hypothetical protein [Deltaproteobacteria bacterium]
MRAVLLVVLLSVACGPQAHVYPSRIGRPELSCEPDTGACDVLDIHDVPFGREASATVVLHNAGYGVLHVDLDSNDERFAVTPGEALLDAHASRDLVVTYTPTDFDPAAAVLEVAHDGSGGVVSLDLHGTTDDDADDDGYRNEAAPEGDDCNDFNASVHPGAEETWYDGVDQDCSGGSDDDADGDGCDAITAGGDDCDDSDPDIHPGADDPKGDGIDQDCDGSDG